MKENDTTLAANEDAQQARPPASITTSDGVFVAPLGGGLVSLSANALPGETPDTLLERLQREARRRRLAAVQGNIFADPALGRAAAPLDFPVSFLGRHDTPSGDLRGARVLALPQGGFERVADASGAPAGARWETPAARYLLLGALTPADTTASFDSQSAAVWRDLQAALHAQGFALTDIARTWFFNHRILEWYDDFNRVRTAFFKENNIFGTLVPASTGVGASNAQGAALTLDALAIAPRRDNAAGAADVTAIPSPLQCPANDYKSAFSRAVEVNDASGRHLLISGTASIAPDGLTEHKDDLDAQIKLSLRVTAAILESRGMDWRDVSRAVLYFPEIAWMSRFEPCRAALGMPPIPAVFAHCDICRDDLLFEIELDAHQSPRE
jgi:enamine deaminase RidA (YjgF/YER057c/UK114 family)